MAPPAPLPAPPSAEFCNVESVGKSKEDPGALHLFRSKLPDIYIPDDLPLAEYCLERASDYADKPCIIQTTGAAGAVSVSYTYAEVCDAGRKIALGLARLGVGRGEVIMLLLPNCSEFALSFLGAAMRGAVTTTCNPFYTPAEIAKQVSGSGPKLIITQSAYIDKLADVDKIVHNDNHVSNVITIDEPPANAHVSAFNIFSFSCLLQEELEENAAERDAPSIQPDDVVALPYSSGTTGLPKGVMLTHRSLVTSVAQQVDGDNPNLHFRSDDVVLCVLPLFHIYSLNSVLLCSLRVGATIAMMPKFEIGALLEVIERHRVTVAPLVPPIVLALAKNPLVDKYDLSSIRMLMSGAAPLGKDLEDAFKARVPHAIIGQGYGMTEAGPVLAMSLAFAKYPFPVKAGSCGTVVRNAVMKIIDPETGLSVPHNSPGELCIKGAQIMKGYINDPIATSNTIDKDGFLHTGDIGLIDEDEEVFIVDRVKEIIKFKGFQVPPAELEGILVSHPRIADAACVPKKDEAAGEVPVAFVVAAGESTLSEDEVKDFVSKQVVFYKKLHDVIFVDKIPKSPSGKILRKDLRARLEVIGKQ